MQFIQKVKQQNPNLHHHSSVCRVKNTDEGVGGSELKLPVLFISFKTALGKSLSLSKPASFCLKVDKIF